MTDNPMTDLTAAAARTDELARRADEHHANLEQIARREHFTDEHKQQQRREAQTEFEAYLGETVRAARTALDEAEAKAAKVLNSEAAKAPAVERVSRLLFAKGPATTLQVLAESEDAAGLRALRAEVPAYAATLDLPPAGRKATTADLLLAVDRALRPFTSGAEADAIDVRDRVDAERARLDATFGFAFRRSPASRVAYAYATGAKAS